MSLPGKFPTCGRPWLALAAGFSLLALLLAACGDITPTAKTNQLLINEVFTGAVLYDTQWIELLNNTANPINLDGYSLETTGGKIALGQVAAGQPLAKGAIFIVANNPALVNEAAFKAMQDSARDAQARDLLKRPPLPLEERQVLGTLNPAKDFVVLKGPDGQILDQVGWGGVDPATRARLGSQSELNANLLPPNSDQKSLGRTAAFGQRPASDPGPINPGIFTLHNTPTPGRGDTLRSNASYQFLFTGFTDIVATLGGALLWLAFFIIALVARRFETLTGQKTYWQYLMAAPVGILIYAIIQVTDFIVSGRLTDFWSWPAFLALFISGLACVYVVNIFRLIAKHILEA
jgi:hypothetical protein